MWPFLKPKTEPKQLVNSLKHGPCMFSKKNVRIRPKNKHIPSNFPKIRASPSLTQNHQQQPKMHPTRSKSTSKKIHCQPTIAEASHLSAPSGHTIKLPWGQILVTWVREPQRSSNQTSWNDSPEKNSSLKDWYSIPVRIISRCAFFSLTKLVAHGKHWSSSLSGSLEPRCS